MPPPFKPNVSSSEDYHNFDKPATNEEIEEKHIEESLPWKKDILYDGFTYKADNMLNKAASDDLSSGIP